MQREMALADVDGNGTIYWEEFTALMWELGKVEGAETQPCAPHMPLERRQKSTRKTSDTPSIAAGSDLAAQTPSQHRAVPFCMETQNGRSMVCCLRHVLSEQLPNDVAAVVRVIAPEGSRVQLNASAPTGKQERN